MGQGFSIEGLVYVEKVHSNDSNRTGLLASDILWAIQCSDVYENPGTQRANSFDRNAGIEQPD
jgi:hypothetical protein